MTLTIQAKELQTGDVLADGRVVEYVVAGANVMAKLRCPTCGEGDRYFIAPADELQITRPAPEVAPHERTTEQAR